MSERREEPEYACPACGTISDFIVSDEQAFCTNTRTCAIVAFNPMYTYTEADLGTAHNIYFDPEKHDP